MACIAKRFSTCAAVIERGMASYKFPVSGQIDIMLSAVMFSHIVPVNLHRHHGNDVCEAAGVWVVDGGSSPSTGSRY